MTEAMAVEAVRAVSGGVTQPMATQAALDPNAISAFEDAMRPSPVSDIPFASQVREAWSAAEATHQTHLHRMQALSDLALGSVPSVAGMSQLQYEVATTAFQLEVVTSVAKKASDAVSTLVKNG